MHNFHQIKIKFFLSSLYFVHINRYIRVDLEAQLFYKPDGQAFVPSDSDANTFPPTTVSFDTGNNLRPLTMFAISSSN